MSHENKDELRQLLLELHYDLLEESEARKLRAEIEVDPIVATEWAATLHLASKLTDAAKSEGAKSPKLNITRLAGSIHAQPSSNGNASPNSQPIIARIVEAEPDPNAGTSGPANVSRAGSRRWWISSTGLAATAAAIGLIIIGSWYGQRVPEPPNGVVRMQAEPVRAQRAQSDNEFHLVTTRIDASSSSVTGFPVTPATLSFSVLARNMVLFSGTTETGSDGSGTITLPPDLVIPKDAKLRIRARSVDQRLSESSIEVPLEPTRCLTYLIVDRPVYRPGETVYFRSLTLQRRSLRVNSEVPIRFELVDPSGAVVPGAFTEGVTLRGVGNGSFLIPSTAPGGPYTLVAKSLDEFFPEERCKFQVRAYRVPRFKKELEFRQRSYGPGETVDVDFTALRAEGGPLVGATIRVTAKLDDKVIHQSTTTNSPSGNLLISFTLPTLISQGVGQVSVTVDDGGTRETKSKTIPIQLGRVAVDFYPEGGYLVAGLRNRVYFTARNSLGEPIHIKGEILNRAGESVAEIETKRDSMGRFKFVPKRAERYSLKVIQPVDVTNNPMLPAVVKDLPVIDTGSGVFDAQGAITMVVRTNKSMRAVVRAVCRGQLVGEQKVDLRNGDNSLSLPIRDDTSGVIRVTLLDANTVPAQPLVERLVFRRNEKQLHVEIVDAESALRRSPGEPLRLTLQVRDETGKPATAVLGVSVVDDAALSLDKTERPQLRTHFLLTSEVQKPEDLEHANFYLSDHPEAAESLDLLLGTQGWRRFVRGSGSQPDVDFREQLIRLIELDGNNLATAPKNFDNSSKFSQQWSSYRAAVRRAWQRLVMEARLLMFVVLLLWLLSIMMHIRRHATLNVAMWLLVASTSAFIHGCGGSPTTTVVSSTETASAIADAADDGREMSVDGTKVADMSQAADEERTSDPTRAPAKTIATNRAVNDEMAMGDPSPKSQDVQWAEQDGVSFAGVQPSRLESVTRSISKQDLKRLLAARGLDREALADQLLDELRFPIRQYAHRHSSADSEFREDFAETLFWQPMLITDSLGRATIRFDLSDSVTTFRVNVDGHSTDGRIGSGGGNVTSRLPFQIEPKLPLEVTTGDRIDLPIAVINATDADLEVKVSLSTDASLQPTGDTTRVLQLSGEERRREHISLDVVAGSAEHDAAIEIRGVGTLSLTDSVRRLIHISPAGYPARESIAGQLSNHAVVQLPIPKHIVPGSLAVTLRAYPSPIADFVSGVESILQEPHGCFEQTSATNYPNTMALLYLKKSQTANPEVSRRALGMLDRGYQKLISFECQKRGYEWFGSDPGHEALSAFGLMQFADMAQVMAVSEKMVARTRSWLLARRDSQGGFLRNPRHLHVWSVQQPIINAYVLWAVSEADVAAGQPHRAATELASELDQLNRVARDSDDPYLVALSAAALMNVKRTDEGEFLLQKLSGLQNEDGSLQGKTTVTSSGGLSLTMETTALATIAWIKSPRFTANAQSAAKWIVGNRLGNAGFGSTQATVLALKALVAMAGNSHSRAGGMLQIQCAGELIGQVKLPDQSRSGSTVEIKGLGSKLEAFTKDGKPVEIELFGRDARNLSYTIDIASHLITPNSDDACPIQLSTKMTGQFAGDGSVAAGQTLKVETRLVNKTAQGQPMTVAIVGLPGGVEPRAEELDELQKSGQFDYYETRGREIIFYWRTIEPQAVKQIEFNVTAAIPGKYTGPASRAYLYYTAEQKDWSEPLIVEIKP